MKKFDLALSLVAVAHHEAEAHKAEMKKNPGWYSDHGLTIGVAQLPTAAKRRTHDHK